MIPRVFQNESDLKVQSDDKRLKNPGMIKFREEAGVDDASLEIITLVE